MLNTIKKIFGKSTSEKGILTIQEQSLKDIKMEVHGDKIHFVGHELPNLEISSISDLELKDASLSFIHEEKKYKFESESSDLIYQKLKSLVSNKYIFRSEKFSYYIYDTTARVFELYKEPLVIKIIFDTNFYLRIEDDTSIIHYEQISTATQYYMDQENCSFVWSVYVEGVFHTFCIEFTERLDFLEFSAKYVECCYKSVNPNNEFKFFENMATTSGQIKNKVEENIPEAPPSNDEWLEFDAASPSKIDFNKDEKLNKNLVIGNDMVFVTRGSSLGVFDLGADDLNFRTQVQNVLNDPHKIITHNQSQSLLVLDKEQRDKLQVLDLNRGEVVEKWDIDENVNDYFNSVKYCNDGTLVGMSDYSLFRIDPRMKDKVVDKNTYKSKNIFSCGIATNTGDVAIASKKGDLRLYNKIEKRAKSLLPGFGDEIVGIDSSKDGAMILCTCKNYILLFKVNADYALPIGKDKPTPKRLQLKPQHLSLLKEEISFTPAKFDKDDTLIVTSTGRFVIKWNVDDVKSGNVYNYSLKALYDVIVDENFVMNGDDIIVALPNDIKKVTEKELRKPK